MDLFEVVSKRPTPAPEVKTSKAKYKSTFKEVFQYLLQKKDIDVSFHPIVIMKALVNAREYVPYCSLFDYYAFSIDETILKDMMYYLLPACNKTYFGYPKLTKFTIDEEDLKYEFEANNISQTEVLLYRKFFTGQIS